MSGTIGVGNAGAVSVGGVNVVTTSGEGLSPEYWAERLTSKIVHVAENSESVIKQQALEFRDEIQTVCAIFIANAIKSDRTTIYNLLVNQGHKEMAEIIRRL